MQFDTNADFPAGLVAADPPPFPDANPIPCIPIQTRVYHPKRNVVTRAQNVLLRMQSSSTTMTGGGFASHNISSGGDGGGLDTMDDGDDYMSSSSSSFSSSSSSSSGMMEDEEAEGDGAAGVHIQQQDSDNNDNNAAGIDRAYWMQRTIREAIYGKVLFAVVLRKRRTTSRVVGQQGDDAEWEVTSEHCAIKEMSWQHIRRERDHLAEDPIKEVNAMQFIKQWHQSCQFAANLPTDDEVVRSYAAIMETNIMMPLDLLSDERNLYSVMPFCDGGELFDRLDLNERFSEDEARYWMHQILNGLENLQHAGICHRDMSLENMLVHKSGALIIDMGMCLRIPYQSADGTSSGLEDFFQNMNIINGTQQQITTQTQTQTPATTTPLTTQQQSQQLQQQPIQFPTMKYKPRVLIKPQGTCGKWIYMSPEIYKNKEPFDGYAVDMWAAGVILFLMLTGFPPWERACATDERFKYMTAGYLVQMLTEWEIPISIDAMDLLQRMLWIDPKDRLSLEQVRAHPWMTANPAAAAQMPLGLQQQFG